MFYSGEAAIFLTGAGLRVKIVSNFVRCVKRKISGLDIEFQIVVFQADSDRASMG